MSPVKSKWMTTTALSVVFLSAGAAAQSAPATDGTAVETVQVTGYRESLQKAIDLKRDAVDSEDSILATDIAAFPDLNLAESMQRIPGIAITRDAGEGRQIVLRGLGPDFTRTQLNGMEVLSNTASGMDNRGNVSRTRAFDFSLFASELFDKVTVQKSYDAQQDEGGIAGTVELYTAKPFDYDGFKAVVAAKGIVNTNTTSVTPRVVGLISDRWGDFGALLSVAYSTEDSNEYGYRNWGWGQITVGAKNIGPGVSAADAQRLETAGSNEVFAPQAETYSTWFTHRQRLGITSAFQYQPSDRLSLGVDLLFGQLTNTRNDYALAAAGTNGLTGNVSGTQLLNSITITGNTITAANWSGVDMRSEENQENDQTNFYQAAFNGSYQVSDDFRVKALAGYSRSDYYLPDFDKVFLESKNHDISFDYSDPNHPKNTYDFDTTNLDAWNLMRMDTQANSIVSDYVNGKVDFEWTPWDGSTFTFGTEYKKFMNDGWQRTNKVYHNTPTDTVIPDADKQLVPYDTDLQYVVGNVDKTYAYIGQTRVMTSAYNVPGSDYEVAEKTLAAYAEYALDTQLAGHRVRANIGARYFTTDVLSSGTLVTTPSTGGSVIEPVAISHHYNLWIGAANVAVDLTDDLLVRFSANRNISRPALGDLAATGTLTTAPFGGSISAGNPNLHPFMADAVEASLEYYEGKTGYASIGGFYKNMEDYITDTTLTEPYSATGYPTSFLLAGESPDAPYNYTTPINGKGAHIAGIEAAVQRDFDFLPAPFDGLGVTGNVTYADGNSPIIYSGQSILLPLINLSKLSANATLYYQTGKWDFRISDAYRGRYLDGSGGNNNIGEWYKPTNNIDFAAHYSINDRLKAVIEGVNLTNQPIAQYVDKTAKRPEVVTTSGETFSFGLTYDF